MFLITSSPSLSWNEKIDVWQEIAILLTEYKRRWWN